MCSGDELGHSQQGSNNAYCQDNEITWLNWELDDDQRDFLDFVRKVTLLWRTQPVFQRRRFFQGRGIRGSEVKDISWFEPSGKDMPDDAWANGFVRCLGVRLAGDLIGDTDDRGEPIVGETLLILLNAHHDNIPFELPVARDEHHWQLVFDTADTKAGSTTFGGGDQYALQGRSLAVFRIRGHEEPSTLTLLQVETLIKDNRTFPAHSDRPAMATPP